MPQVSDSGRLPVTPDLLHATPTLRIDREATDLALVMAFAGGTSGGLFADALTAAPVAPSSWEPSSYAADLFLQDFVTHCFQIRIGGHQPTVMNGPLLKLLATPPLEMATLDVRRLVIWELTEKPELRAKLEQLYGKLCRFRALLEGTTAPGGWDSGRRQLDVLQVFKRLMESLVDDFAAAESGLLRLADFGRHVQNSEGFQSLTDLLRYDEKLATANFNVSIGADGRVRSLELVRLQEEQDNPFAASPWRRFLTRLEFLARGFRFTEGEVMARLLDAVFEGVRPHFVPLVQLLGDVEFYLGALGFCDRAKAAGLAVCLPELVPAGQRRELKGLFNPLLLMQARPVPCNVSIEGPDSTVLVTGPNSGGKTRLLQSLGLTQLLAQAGLFVPAASAQVLPAPGLVVSLIQETRVDQTEGRLGVELIRIRKLFESLPPGAMVILDELCSGTNPSEGQEIFELVLRMLNLLRPQAFITTHFLDFAAKLESGRKIHGLRFLQVELGQEQRPTYQFAPGVAATSLAGQAAARLGVTGDQLMALIARNVAASGGTAPAEGPSTGADQGS